MVRRSRVAGVAIEDALELWAVSLREVERRMRPLFTQERGAVSAGVVLGGAPRPPRRQTGGGPGRGGGGPPPPRGRGEPPRRARGGAEAAGDPGPWRQQAILGRGRWEADALREVVRDYALERLADQDAVLVLDETGFLKQGKSSCGVARQYTGSAGKVTDCQIGVLPPTCPGTVTPSSTGRCTCPRPGPTIRPACWPPMSRRRSPSRPSPVSRSR